MKCAIFSDIHGNNAAFQAALTAARRKNVELYLIAGDFMGYYFRLSEIMESIKDLNVHAIRGNHEDMYRDWVEYPEQRSSLEKRYGQSFSRSRDTLTDEQIKWLQTLPEKLELTIDGHNVLICHGAPWDADEYLYPDTDEDKVQRLFGENKSLLIFGHTHYPVHWEENGRHVVNPGSVGQPRDRNPGAAWALWDTAENTVTMHRETYDMAPVINDCLKFSPEQEYLRTVLTRSKWD